MLKLILETLLGGTMERMLKNNNGLTTINTILLIGVAAMTYENHVDNVTNHLDNINNEKAILNVRDALYYKLNIQTSLPLNKRREQSGAITPRDVVLTENKIARDEKEN